MIIVNAPNAMTSCRFKHVLNLYFPHKGDVFIKHLPYQLLKFPFLTKSQPVQTPAEKHEGHLVASPIVDSYIGSPWFVDVSAKLFFGPFDLFRQKRLNEFLCEIGCFVIPILEGLVPISHGLLDWWHFVQEFQKLLEIGIKDGKLLNGFGGWNGLAHDRLK